MARVTGPLISFDIAGALGRELTYQRRGGVQSAALYSKPTGQATAAQLQQRSLMTWLSFMWARDYSLVHLSYDLIGFEQNNVPRAEFLKANLSALKGATSLANFQPNKSSRRAPRMPDLVVSKVGGAITVTAPIGAMPVGMVVLAVTLGIFRSIAPAGKTLPASFSAGDTVPPYSQTFATGTTGRTWLPWARYRVQDATGYVSFSARTAPLITT